MKWLKSFSLKNYRGIKRTQKLELAEMNNVTFLVGPNNSGKSIIARLFSLFGRRVDHINNSYFRISGVTDRDFFDFNTDNWIELEFEIDKYSFAKSKIDSFSEKEMLGVVDSFEKFFFGIKIIKHNSQYNCCLYMSNGQFDSHETFVDDNHHLSHRLSEQFIMAMKNYTYDDSEYSVRIFLNKIFESLQKHILIFDSIRSFDRETDYATTGSELLLWLQEGKNHGEIRRAKEKVSEWLKELNLDVPRAVRVEEVRRTILNENGILDQSAEPEIKKELLFTFENHLELSSNEIGTGYTMLYILLMEIARNKKRLIIIDEIESHLQPGLVRVLMSIIKNYGEAQYIIATHSSTVIDAATDEDVFYQFKKENDECKIVGFKRDWSKDSTNAHRLREVCHELGIIPGDALLSNTVIWVEGPSEVLWLRAWLKCYYPLYRKEQGLQEKLIEGLHYSILMTGGNLIAHYAFSEDEIELDEIEEEQMVNVLKVNPNPFVMVDWDNPQEGSGKHNRTFRIAREINEQNRNHPVFRDSEIEDENKIKSEYEKIPNLWILKGKELENYAHPKLLEEFYRKLGNKKNSKVKEVDSVRSWNVFSSTNGAGRILAKRGLKGACAKSGTLNHKRELAHFVFKNLKPEHFELTEEKFLSPDPAMLDDLTKNLQKMIHYIRRANGMDSK